MVRAKRRPAAQAYDMFPGATPGDIARLGLVVVESDAMGSTKMWGRYVATAAEPPRMRRRKQRKDPTI